MSTLNLAQLKVEIPKLTSAQANDVNTDGVSLKGDTVWMPSYGSGTSYSSSDIANSIAALSDSDYFNLQDQSGYSVRGKRSSRPC